MKPILIITAFPPNNKTAGQNYTQNLISDLSNNGYIIDIVYFSYDNHKVYEFKNKNVNYIFSINSTKIKKISNAILLFFIFPFFSVRFSLKLVRYIIKNQKKYDIVYLDFSQVFIYGLLLKSSKKFLMAHDIIIQKYNRKFKNFFLKKWIKFSENLILKQKNSKIICFSNKDLALLKREYNMLGEKVDFYIDEGIKHKTLEKVENYFCFYGAWHREENLESLEWFEKQIKGKLRFDVKIIGGGLTEKYQEILKKKGFNILGFVENPYDVLMRSKGLIAPLFKGAGVKVKVIEALACGTPVVGTEIALEGIDFESRLIEKVTSFNEVLKVLAKFEKVTLKDKQELKNSFNNEYGKNRFINIIKGYK